MTDIYEKHTEVKEVTLERHIRTECDWCHAEIHHHDPQQKNYRSPVEFMTDYDNWGSDGGFAKGWEVEDLCQACGMKLRRILEDAGVRIHEVDRDW
jgi:hypothetical protein